MGRTDDTAALMADPTPLTPSRLKQVRESVQRARRAQTADELWDIELGENILSDVDHALGESITQAETLERWEQKRTEGRVNTHIETIKAHHEIVSAKDAEIARLREALEEALEKRPQATDGLTYVTESELQIILAVLARDPHGTEKRLHNLVDGLGTCERCESRCDGPDDPVVFCAKCADRLATGDP